MPFITHITSYTAVCFVIYFNTALRTNTGHQVDESMKVGRVGRGGGVWGKKSFFGSLTNQHSDSSLRLYSTRTTYCQKEQRCQKWVICDSGRVNQNIPWKGSQYCDFHNLPRQRKLGRSYFFCYFPIDLRRFWGVHQVGKNEFTSSCLFFAVLLVAFLALLLGQWCQHK